jgi:hypothetical protein
MKTQAGISLIYNRLVFIWTGHCPVSKACLILSRVWGLCVTYKTGGWIGLLDLLHPIYSHNLGLRPSSAIADLRNLEFTAANTLGFSVFTSRILSTDL